MKDGHRQADGDGPAVTTGRALLVEDNVLIALDVEAMLRELGAEAVAVTASVGEAMAAIDADRPDFALLDVDLGRETSLPVARRLAELGVPFLFATGCALPPERAGALADVPVVSKPYGVEMLRAAFAARG